MGQAFAPSMMLLKAYTVSSAKYAVLGNCSRENKNAKTNNRGGDICSGCLAVRPAGACSTG